MDGAENKGHPETVIMDGAWILLESPASPWRFDSLTRKPATEADQ